MPTLMSLFAAANHADLVRGAIEAGEPKGKVGRSHAAACGQAKFFDAVLFVWDKSARENNGGFNRHIGNGLIDGIALFNGASAVAKQRDLGVRRNCNPRRYLDINGSDVLAVSVCGAAGVYARYCPQPVLNIEVGQRRADVGCSLCGHWHLRNAVGCVVPGTHRGLNRRYKGGLVWRQARSVWRRGSDVGPVKPEACGDNQQADKPFNRLVFILSRGFFCHFYRSTHFNILPRNKTVLRGKRQSRRASAGQRPSIAL